MKIYASLFLSLSWAAFAVAQFPSPQIQVLRASYGTDSYQTDVTATVQALIQTGQVSTKAANLTFGTDPDFGRVKKLVVLYAIGEVQYRSECHEGEPLSVLNNASAVVGTQTDSAATNSADGRQSPKDVGPVGPCFLVKPVSVSNHGAVISLGAGTATQFVRQSDNDVVLRLGDLEFSAPRDAVTIDPVQGGSVKEPVHPLTADGDEK